MLKMFLIDSNMPAPLCARGRGDGFGPSSGPGDFLQGRLAEAVRLHDNRSGQLAVAEHLEARAQLLHQAFLDQALRGDLALERVERPEVDHRVLLAKQVGEPALRNPALQRHLAALEAEVLLAPGARQLPLVARRGGLAVSGARAAADPLRLLARSLRGLEVRQVESTRHDRPPRYARGEEWRSPCRAPPGCRVVPHDGAGGEGRATGGCASAGRGIQCRSRTAR